MYTFNQLKTLELEISNNCQASCPMCPRNIHGGIENPYLKLNDWTLDDFKTIVNNEVLNTIESILFCGSFGDPILNKDFPEMLSYLKEQKPDISVEVHTNGSMRSTTFWKELANCMPLKHKILFAIDGTDQETHALYRVGTYYDKILENASVFMSNGGNAVWNFLRFKHNEHQVEQARTISNSMGFMDFTIKDTRRFDEDKFQVLDKNGNVTHFLEVPSINKNGVVNMIHIKKTEPLWKESKNLFCYAKEYKILYINANKQVLPCCIKGSFIEMYFDVELYKKYNLYNSNSVNTMGNGIKQEVLDIMQEFGPDFLDCNKHSLKEIIESDAWQTVWTKHWENKSSTACQLMCSKVSPFIAMEEQRT